MSLAERIAASPPPTLHGLPCSVGHLAERLDKAERAALEAMLADPVWNATAIWEALDAEGHTVGRQTIGRHRLKQCRCFAVSS